MTNQTATYYKARNEVAGLLRGLRELKIIHAEQRDWLQTTANNAVEDAYKAQYPKRKNTWDLIWKRDPDLCKAIYDPYKERATVLFKTQRAEIKDIKVQLRDAIENRFAFETDSVYQLWKSVCVSQYHTQGLGARKYARERAEEDANTARHNGLNAVVALRKEPYTYAGKEKHLVYFDVLVNAKDSVDLQALDFAPTPTLKETVAGMWKRGVNPRVYMPFLPHGYEEKNGIPFM